MIYFVPAWYTDPQHWWAERHYWYREPKEKYDGFLSQLRMFVQEKEEVTLLNLSHFTGFQRMRFAETLGGLACISLFDCMQSVDLTECAAFSFKDFPWKGPMEWVYTPFLIWGYLNGEIKARVEFARTGDVTEISFYEKERVYLKYCVDERGFISIVFRYERNEPPYAYYMNPSGQIQFRENLESGEITIALDAEHTFQKRRYACMRELVKETLGDRISFLGKDDTVIVAADRLHNSLFLDSGRAFRTVLFIDGDQNDTCALEEMQEADFLVTDSEWERNRILARYPSLDSRIMVIAPVDARLGFGKSTEIRAKKIFLHADMVEDADFARVLSYMAEILKADDNVELYVTAPPQPGKWPDGLKEDLAARIEALSELSVDREEKDLGENNVVDEMPGKEPDRVFVRSYQEIQDLEKVLSETRLIVDLGREPSELIQVAGISMGIPQIHLVETRHIIHGQEGHVIAGIEELPAAIRSYLYDLRKWNEAFMYCARKVRDYSGRAIVDRWKGHIEAVRR